MVKEYLLTDEILFDLKAEAVPYNYRISYKISQVCLIISKCCIKSNCSLVKLNLISNALTSVLVMKELKDYLNGNAEIIITRFDPVINRVIKFAVADGLVQQQPNGKIALTLKGNELVQKIDKEDVLLKEKEQLKDLGKKLTEKKVEKIISFWRYENAGNQKNKN